MAKDEPGAHPLPRPQSPPAGAASGPPPVPAAPEQPTRHDPGHKTGAEAGHESGLSELDRAVLGVERRTWPGPGAKERAIRERLDISPTRYYQLLNALLDDPRALAHDPVTVNRLRRLRDQRRRRR